MSSDISTVESPDLVVGTSLWKDAWKRLRKNRMSLICGYIVASIIVACIVGPWIMRAFGYDY